MNTVPSSHFFSPLLFIRERPLCFKPEKIAVKPRKSDKCAKACNSPLLT